MVNSNKKKDYALSNFSGLVRYVRPNEQQVLSGRVELLLGCVETHPTDLAFYLAA